VALHRPSGRALVVLALGAVAVLAAVAVDPAALGLLLDLDFVIAIGSAGVLMLGADLRALGRRAAITAPGVLARAGAAATRRRPGSLLA
jgi:hypothetical protein